MSGFRYTTLLSLVVIVISGFIVSYWAEAQGALLSDGSSSTYSGRNERSTPRSFILPATPAVALEQELRSNSHLNEEQAGVLARCSARLAVLGYDVGDEMVSFNAKLVEATYLYQERHGLAASGRLNQETRVSLQC